MEHTCVYVHAYMRTQLTTEAKKKVSKEKGTATTITDLNVHKTAMNARNKRRGFLISLLPRQRCRCCRRRHRLTEQRKIEFELQLSLSLSWWLHYSNENVYISAHIRPFKKLSKYEAIARPKKNVARTKPNKKNQLL